MNFLGLNLMISIKKRVKQMGRRYRGKNKNRNKNKVTVMANISEDDPKTNGVGGVGKATATASPSKDDANKVTSMQKTQTNKAVTAATQTKGKNEPYKANKSVNEGRGFVHLMTDQNKHMSGSVYVRLYEILTYMRPAGSKAEEAMIKKFIDPYKPKIDSFGNRIIAVPMSNGGRSKTLFTCHTDTVHKTSGRQKIFLDPERQEIFVDDSDCLGADDGTGIYIMLRMIDAKVPGTYIFHRAEEIGGQGSAHIRKTNSAWLKWYDRAIAFDRKGEGDVIIAQSVGIIASTEFGEALAKQLNLNNGLNFMNCKMGTFTDTANYYESINECINLSVGYERQHTSSETQSISFLQKLLPRLLYTNWELLPTERDKGHAAPKYPQNQWQNNFGGNRGANGQNRGNTQTENFIPEVAKDYLTERKIAMLVMHDPRIAVELLIAMHPSTDDLWDAEWETQLATRDMLNDFNTIHGM